MRVIIVFLLYILSVVPSSGQEVRFYGHHGHHGYYGFHGYPGFYGYFGYVPEYRYRPYYGGRSEEYRLRSDWRYLMAYGYPSYSYQVQKWYSRARDFCWRQGYAPYEIRACIRSLQR